MLIGLVVVQDDAAKNTGPSLHEVGQQNIALTAETKTLINTEKKPGRETTATPCTSQIKLNSDDIRLVSKITYWISRKAPPAKPDSCSQSLII